MNTTERLDKILDDLNTPTNYREGGRLEILKLIANERLNEWHIAPHLTLEESKRHIKELRDLSNSGQVNV